MSKKSGDKLSMKMKITNNIRTNLSKSENFEKRTDKFSNVLKILKNVRTNIKNENLKNALTFLNKNLKNTKRYGLTNLPKN